MSSAVQKYLELKKELNEDKTSYSYIKKKLAKKRGLDFSVKEQQEINFENVENLQFEQIEEKEENKIDFVQKVTQTISKQEEIKEEINTDYTRIKAELDFLRKELESLRRVQPKFNAPLVGSSGGGELNNLKPVMTVVDYDILGSGGRDLILCDTELNDISITLPQVSKNNGYIAHVKKIHPNHQVYIRGYDNTQLIDGQELIVIRTNMVTLQIVSDGSNWYIV